MLLLWRRAFGMEPLPARTIAVQGRDLTATMSAGDDLASGLEIELNDGRRVRFAPDTDAEKMKQILSVLEDDAGMMVLPSGVPVHLATGYADPQKGIDGLAVTVQQVLGLDPFSGDLFVFRGRRADTLKILFWDGTGLCFLTKRLETGAFPWPIAQSGVESISSAQFSMLLEGLDWKRPERVWRPAVAG